MAILNGLQKILDFFVFIVEYVVGLVKSTVLGLQVLKDSMLFPLDFASFLPTIFGACIICVVVVGSIKFLFGRL